MTAHPGIPSTRYPLPAMTTYELRDYRGELEHAIKRTASGVPVLANLRAKLDAVIAEQADRARIAADA